MKRLLFEKLTLLSAKERSGLELAFHQNATILKGENDVGKSSVLKSLLKTFGTQPHMETDRWKNAVVQSLVDFSVDGVGYSILRSRNSFGLFDQSGEIIASYSSVTNELSPKLAELFSFHLSLNSRNADSTQATPAFLFLPFYADQDRSWVSTMDSFDRLSQFQNYRRDVVWFHTGIRPNGFYLAKADKIVAEREQEEQKQNRDIVMHAVKRVQSLFEGNEFALDPKDFRDEIDELIEASRALAEKEATLKEKMVATQNLQIAVDSQLAIVLHAANELGEDFDFASQNVDDSVECPTCGAHYENSVAERFAIASDEDTCRELIDELQTQKRKLQEEYASLLEESSVIHDESTRVGKLLASKQGDVNLQSVLQSEGRRQVKDALLDDVRVINLAIGELDQRISEADARMKAATNSKRSRRIKEYYQERMSEFLDELGIRSTESDRYTKIDCKITESGSDGPRALLAYQFAILHTINEFSSSTFCPIIIDSPNQQDQDDDNWNRIKEFIATRRPENSQLILALVDDGTTDFGGNTVEFNQKYRVLDKETYETCAERMRPMIDAMIAARL